MTDKDPKDMTVSELLRKAAIRETDEYGNITPHVKMFSALAGEDAAMTDYVDRGGLMRQLADKIDAELAEARKEAVNESKKPMWWFRSAIKCGYDWPEPRDGENFRDYLHRCFLPRPRFEDGEPVQMGDEIAICGGDIDVNEVVMLLDGSGYRLLHSTDVSASAIEDRVKRPAPEALGADGLPIVVGETVYPIDSEWLDTTLEVLSVESLSVKVSLPSGKGWTMFRAKDLTHTPPDTQQRIDEDATLPPREYYNAHIGHDVGLKDDEEVAVAMVLDLLRRQRELDKRTGGAE